MKGWRGEDPTSCGGQMQGDGGAAGRTGLKAAVVTGAALYSIPNTRGPIPHATTPTPTHAHSYPPPLLPTLTPTHPHSYPRPLLPTHTPTHPHSYPPSRLGATQPKKGLTATCVRVCVCVGGGGPCMFK